MSTISAGTLINNGLNWSSDTTGNLVFLTNGTTTATTINTSQYMLGNVLGMGAGVYPAEQYYLLQTGYTGQNATGAQSVFGLPNGVTLAGNTIYQFEGMYALSKSVGTTSAYINLGFGGTATLNNIAYVVSYDFNNTSFINEVGSGFMPFIQTASLTQTSFASTTAAVFYKAIVKGTVSVNAGGTFLPQYSLSAAPGGAYTTAAGSYFKIAPLGAAGSNISNGTWS